jgi:hypothetical protein
LRIHSARIGAAGAETLQRIGDEGERLVFDDDPLDGFNSGQFIDRGDGEDRLTLVHGLHRQRPFVVRIGLDLLTEVGHAPSRLGEVGGGQNRLDAWHRQRGARIDARDARVRHRAEQLTREQHAIGAEILGEFGTAGHLGDHVRRRVVPTNEPVVRHGVPPQSCADVSLAHKNSSSARSPTPDLSV